MRGNLHLIQAGSFDITSPLIQALNDANVRGLLLVVLVLGIALFVTIWKAIGWRQQIVTNKGNEMASTAQIMVALAGNLTKMADTVIAINVNQQQLQTLSGKRDAQMDAITEVIDTLSDGTKKQNSLLEDQNRKLDELAKINETGHVFTRNLVEAVTSTSTDTTSALGAMGDNIIKKLEDVQKNLADLMLSLPEMYAKQTINSYSAVKLSMVDLAKEITRLHAPVIQENQELREQCRLQEVQIVSLTQRLTAALEKKAEEPAPKDNIEAAA
jgi:hypothetical protein